MVPKINDDDPAFGFWALTWRARRRLLSWELPVAAAAGVLVAFLGSSHTLGSVLPGLLYAELGVFGALVGLTLAGLAIIAAFISRDMVRVLAQVPGGVDGEFFPFMYVAVLGLVGIGIDTAFLLTDMSRPNASVRLAAIATTAVFTYTLCATASLVGALIALGSNRARQLLAEEKPSS